MRMTNSYRPDGGWGWMIAGGSLLIGVIVDGVKYSFGLLFIELLDTFGASRSDTSWIISIQVGISYFTGPLTGALVNRFGCRKVAIAGTLFSFVGFGISPFATSIYFLYASFGFLGGIGFGMMMLPFCVSVVRYFDKYLALATGISAMGPGLGTIIFNPLTKALIDRYTWRGTLLVEAGLVLNGLVCAVLLRQPGGQSSSTDRDKPERPHELDQRVHSEDADGTARYVKSDKPVTDEDIDGQVERVNVKQQKDSRGIDTDDTLECVSTLDKQGNSANIDESNMSVEPDQPTNNVDLYEPVERLELDQWVSSSADINGPMEPYQLPNEVDRYNSSECNTTDHYGGHGDEERWGQLYLDVEAEYVEPDHLVNGVDKDHFDDYAGVVRSRQPLLGVRALHAKSGKKGVEACDLRSDAIAATQTPGKPRVQRQDGSLLSLHEFQCGSANTFGKPISSKTPNTTGCDIDKQHSWITLKPLRNVGFLILMASTILIELSLIVPFTFLPDMMIVRGHSSAKTVWIISLIGLCSTVSRVLAGAMADLKCVNRVVLCIICIIATGVTMAFFPLCSNYTSFVVLAVAFGISAGSSCSLRGILIPDLFGIETIADCIGISMFFSGTAAFVSLPLAGYITDISGSYSLSFVVAGIEMVVGGAVIGIIHCLNNAKIER